MQADRVEKTWSGALHREGESESENELDIFAYDR